MNEPDSWNVQDTQAARLGEILLEARRCATPEARERYLHQVCADDPELRAQAVSLLAAEAAAGDFLGRTVLGDLNEPEAEGPGTMVGPYKLLEKIGEGGFGSVYVAEQQKPIQRRVALKIIKLGMDTRQVVARFEAERQALARMDHPNIAQVFDAGATASGRPYFVMELVRGLKITDYCDRHRLNPQARLALFTDICHAVQHAHQKGVIHRDLKPSNILVAQHDTVAVPKVIDFGIAKATQGRLTERTLYTGWSQMVGTPVYMSPEQAEFSGLDVDTRSDIYSLGVLLYELLTGRTPFESKTLSQAGLDEIRRVIRETQPPRPSTRLSRLSPVELDTVARTRNEPPPRLIGLVRGDLDCIVMKCLEKDRSRRYDTANGLAQDVARYLGHEPILARPPSTVYQFQKWARRNKGLFVAGSAVAAALMIGLGAAVYAAVRERQHTRLLEQSQVALQARTAELQRSLARQYLRQGQVLGEDGDVARALHWMNIGLQQLPPDDQQLRSAILENLASWSSQWIAPDLTLTHDYYVFGADFHPDGNWLVTGTGNGTVTLWSVGSGSKLWARQYPGSKAWPVAVSPDGKTIVFGEWKAHRAHLLRLDNGEPLGSPMLHAGTIFSVGFSPDRRFVITDADHETRIWDAQTGVSVGRPVSHEDTSVVVAFSPDSQRVFSEGQVGWGRLWRAETGEVVSPPLSHGAKIKTAAFSPDGSLIATGGATDQVKLWSTDTGQLAREPLVHGAHLSSLSFSPDGTRLITASEDYLVQVWCVSTGTRIGKPLRHDARVIAASFSADGALLMTVCMDSRVRLWSAATGAPIGRPLSNRTHPGLNLVRFSPDGAKLLTRAENHVLALTSLPEPQPTLPSFEHLGTVHSARFTRDGQTFAAGREFLPEGQGLVGLWSAVTGEELKTLVDHGNPVWDLQFSPDEQQLLTCGLDGLAKVWDVATGALLSTLSGHTDDVYAGCYSVDGRFLATGGLGGEARVWSSQTHEPVGPWLVHPAAVTDLVFSYQSAALVTACEDGRVRFWDYRAGDCSLVLELSDRPASLGAVDASPDGRWIVAGGLDKTARFWDARNGQLTGLVLSHEGNVTDITFSPDGRWVLTVTDDGKARLWSVESGEQVGPTLNQGTLVQQGNFSADGSLVILACSPGVGLWRLPQGIPPPPSQATVWVEVLTHQTMDEQGTLSWLNHEEWLARKNQLAKPGG